MFHHVVMFRFVEGTDRGRIEEITSRLADLPDVIDGLVGFRFGSDVGLTDGSWDFAAVADFADADAYVVYRDHPVHRAVVDELIIPILAEAARVQFTT